MRILIATGIFPPGVGGPAKEIKTKTKKEYLEEYKKSWETCLMP